MSERLRRKRDEAGEEKASGIPRGSSGGGRGGGGSGIPRGSGGGRSRSGGSGIPRGSSGGGGGGGGSGIPRGSSGGGGGSGGSGIPRGSSGGGGGGGGSGIPRGSSGGGGGRGGSGMPRGSSIRRGRSGGGGIPRGSKNEQSTVEQKDAGTVIENVDETKGIVEAVVSVTGLRDSVDDIIEPGAYAKTLKDRTPKGVWSHSWSEPISKTLAIKEIMPGDSALPENLPNGEPWPSDAGALWVKTQFNLDSPRGKQAFSDVKFFGDDGSWSIGYKAKKATKDAKTGVRRIKELDLFEYSPVLHGANAHAKTLSVKTLDEAKAALTEGGYDVSKLEVKDIHDDEQFESLDPSEVKDLIAAYDILGAYLSEIGVKRTQVQGDPDMVVPDEDDRWVGGSDDALPMSLVEELEQLLDPDDFSELLEIAADFDDAADDGDDEAAGEIMQDFLDVFEEEEAADPELERLRDVIADVIDDRYPELADSEADEDDDAEDEYDDEEYDEDDEYESDDETDDEYESDEGEYDGDAEEAEPSESAEVSGTEKSALPSMGWADSADLVVSSIDFD